ncbi:MAG: SbcC/MukB-like Walker B domain-containing protein [Clostridium sp.]|nr:SbcC/MukB-like Walker B domain-containing protein [Clostridium sp.]
MDYARINSEKVILEKKIKDIICNKEESVKKILSIEERLNSIKVDPEYREKVQVALEIENEYKQSKVRKDDLEAKINTKRCNLDKYTKEYNEILKAQKVQNNLVIELEKEMEELLKDNPGDNSKLLEKAEKVNSYREKFESALKDDEKRKELINKLDAVEKDIKPVELKLEEAKESLVENKESLEKVAEEIDHINKKNLASILGAELEEGKPCPVCGSLHHISPVKALDKKELESREKEKKKLEKLIEEINTYISKVSLTIVSFQKEREHILKELESIQIKLKDIIIEELKANKENIENEFVLMKDKVQKYVEKKDEITKEITLQKDKKSKIDMKEAKIGEIMRSEKNLLNDLNEEFIKENNKFNKIKDEYLLLKKQLQLDDIPLRMKEIKNYEVESISLQKVEKDLRDIIEKEEKSKEILSIQERKLDIELGKIVQSGKEKAEIIEREEEELKKLSEGQNPQEYLEVIRKEITNINEKAERLKNNLEKEKNNRQQIYDKKLSLEEAKKILQKRFEEQNNKCISSLKENDFTDIEDVLKVILDEKSISEIQQEINIFNDEFKNIMNNISRIEGKLNGEFIEEEKWEQLKKDRLEKQEILKFKIQEIAALQKTIDDIKQDMKELKELRKKEQELQHKLSLLNDLGKLVEGNKFVEFAAMNQLKYIAREASRRLKDITKERYALEIDSDGNFIIRDDFNGGDIRETTTLSGGETFLTSLSLALALSSQVQLKGSAPLEFFFLDEGFGTLDTELLDTVMNSLERLHSSKLSVGIISHVEELKNRVPVKLVVSSSKQGEGGSKVKLEYS